MIVESWRRSREAGLDPDRPELDLVRVPEVELRVRLARRQEMVAAAIPHLEFASETLSDLTHAIYLADADGVVLYATGDRDVMEAFGLQPGFDWSESRMGTNGCGTALVTGAPVAIVGPQHYRAPFKSATCTAAPIRGADGEVLGAIDITTAVAEGHEDRLRLARHVAYVIERTLADRWHASHAHPFPLESHLAAIVQSSDDAIVSKSLRGTILSWNGGAERLYGYTAEEVIGRPITILVAPDHPEEITEIERRLRRAERVAHFETVRMRKDGRPVEVSVSYSPVRDRNERLIGVAAIARDIGELKRREREVERLLAIERARAEQLQRLAALSVGIHRGPDVVSMLQMVTDAARSLIHAQHAIISLRSAGTRAQAVEASSRAPDAPTTIVAPDVAAALGADLCEALEPLRRSREELLERFPGGEGPGAWLGVPLIAHDGSCLGTIQVMDAANVAYTDDDTAVLVQLAQMAAIVVENGRLYEELRRRDRTKDEFLAMLAHELRNPLAPLANGLKILEHRDLPPAAAERTREMMSRQLGHLVRLVDDLLDLSRITRGRIELRPEVLDVAAAIERAVETTRPAIEAGGHLLTVDPPAWPVHVQADPARLAQIFGNLLSNAAKYTPVGGRITLRTEVDDDRVSVRVSDNGLGISARDLPRIFDMFSQGGMVAEEGLGVGLALVKQLVELHGGSVEAHSEGSGKGSEFVVRLPRVPTPAPPAPPAAPPRRERSGVLRVLVVDDNADAADSLGLLLGQMGHEARVVYDGTSALSELETGWADVALVDIGMPDVSGYEVARRSRAHDARQALLIALTGWGQDEDRSRSREAGFSHHLTKPIDLEALQGLLRSVVVQS